MSETSKVPDELESTIGVLSAIEMFLRKHGDDCGDLDAGEAVFLVWACEAKVDALGDLFNELGKEA